jgi:uncharacterized repeat protein (TIGR02543 family)
LFWNYFKIILEESFMKRKKFLRLGLVLPIIAILGLLFSGCDDGGGDKPTTFTVTFDLNATGVTGAPAAAPAPITGLKRGDTINQPLPAPTSASHVFAGWFTEATGGEQWNFATDTVTANRTLYGRWSPRSFSVTFNLNDTGVMGATGLPSQLTNISYDALITAPTAPTSASHSFVGWFKEAAGDNQWFFATDTVTTAITLYAKWTHIHHTVTFDMNPHGLVVGATGNPAAVEIPHGALITLPTAPTSTSHDFAGWWTQAQAGALWNFETGTVTAPMTLYGRWAVKTYTVTFDLNATGVTAPSAVPPARTGVQHGTTIAAPDTVPTSTSHDFDGWFTAATEGTQWVFGTNTVTGNTTLYGRWTIKNHTVTFNLNTVGGQYGVSTLPPPATAQHGGTITSPPANPTSTSHDFTGWWTEATDGTQWNLATGTVTEPITLFARWAIKTYTVTFDLNATGVTNPSAVPPQQTGIQHGATIIDVPTIPTSDSHNFAGWFTAATEGTLWVFATSTVTSNRTLHARWEEKSPLNESQFVYSWDNENNKIIITGNTNLIYGHTAVITGPGTSNYSGWVWSINGIPDTTQTGSTFTFHSLGRSPGNYKIGLYVQYESRWYSAEVTIVIEE